VDNARYPDSSEGLNALVEQPGDLENWRGPYLKKGVPKDPWGNAYVYVYPGRENESSYDLLSLGPDGKKSTDDDITNWSE
jgi:general secretion pathway protein G